MPNPFTSETRETVLTLDNGLISKLRIGDTLQRTIRRHTPGHVGFGDFAPKAMYDEILIGWILAGRYEDVYATIEADWGLPTTAAGPGPTSVTSPHERSGALRKPAAKVEP